MCIIKLFLTCFACCLLAFCVLLTGCKKDAGLKGLVPAKGKITFNDVPVEGASIGFSPNFTGMNARTADTASNENGEFIIQAFPGEYTVAVRKLVSDKTNTKNVLPAKYANAKTSGLTVTVAKGMAPLELKLGGK